MAAGNQPETIASKNCRNVQLMFLLRGNSIDAPCGIDRGVARSDINFGEMAAKFAPSVRRTSFQSARAGWSLHVRN
jgi:hypothetical protein